LAEESKICGSPFFGVICPHSIDEFDSPLPELRRAADSFISATVGALLIVLGLRSLLDSSDPDARSPRWIESIFSMSPPRAFGVGMALFPLQDKNLAIFVACLNLIIAPSLSPQGSIVALMMVLPVFAILVLVLIGFYAAVPQRASTMIGTMQAWLGRNNRAIIVALCFVFGTFFLLRGHLVA
jgi:hypothetical protein